MKFKVENGVLKKCETEQAYEEEIRLPDGVTRIASGSMIGLSCETDKLIIPEGVQRIENFAIDSFFIAREVVFPKSLIYIGKEDLDIHGTKDFYVPNPDAEVSPEAFGSLQHRVKTIIIPALPIENIPNTDSKYGSASVLKEAAAWGYLSHSDLYVDADIIAGYKKYLIRQRKKILSRIFAEDYSDGLTFYSKNGKITDSNIESDYIEPAKKVKAEKCLKWIEDYKTAMGKDAHLKEGKKEKTKAPSVAELKKIWAFRKDDSGDIIITNYKGNETEVSVPENIGKSKVIGIDEEAFSAIKSGRTSASRRAIKSIEKISIPDTVKNIGRRTFYQCQELTELRLPQSVSIETPCFIGCSGLTDEDGNIIFDGVLYWHNDIATDVIVPDNVKVIENGAFDHCSSLKKVQIPDTVTKLCQHSFESCYNLTDINIPESICVEEPCFRNCGKLADENGNIVIDNVLYWHTDDASNARIPDNIVRIGQYAFSGSGQLKAIEIPGTVHVIGRNAFDNCLALSNIIIEEGVKEIEAKAFSFLPEIENLTIPASVETIGDSAFAYCLKLREVIIKNKSVKLGKDLFFGSPVESNE